MKFLTITLAPSLDCYFSCETLNLNKTNRYDLSQLFPGGKGINASLALARHNFETKAISFFDQLSYKKFENFFKQEKISFVNINSKESTRINFKCNQNNPYNFNFELNGPISIISNSQEYQLFNELKELTSNDFVLLMGRGPEELMLKIIKFLNLKKILFALDVDSPNLKKFLKYKPFAIKPNRYELETNFNLIIKNQTDLLYAMKKVKQLGVKNLIVSLDKDGSYLLDENNHFYQAHPIESIDVISAVGAGDTLISIFCAKYLQTLDYSSSFKYANAAAMATVSSSTIAQIKDTNKLQNNVLVTKFN